ncbi:30S ribosomal protein S19e [Candidatus Pacearchaeota archaeon]|nr:30S ribosomal protein S19e [Candidatus Pacearchaeota archaeon]
MTNPREVNPEKYNLSLAEALKSLPDFKVPEWIFFVKTSVHKERPTADPDFWHKRSASVLKQIYIKGSVGVSRLRTRYGGRKRRGGKPEEFRKASGKIIRTILQQAEAAGLLEKTEAPNKGRSLTEKGKEFLESIKIKEEK